MTTAIQQNQPLVSTIVAFPGMPPMRVSITQDGTGSYIVSGPYREPVEFNTYAAAVRTYTNIIDAILATS